MFSGRRQSVHCLSSSLCLPSATFLVSSSRRAVSYRSWAVKVFFPGLSFGHLTDLSMPHWLVFLSTGSSQSSSCWLLLPAMLTTSSSSKFYYYQVLPAIANRFQRDLLPACRCQRLCRSRPCLDLPSQGAVQLEPSDESNSPSHHILLPQQRLPCHCAIHSSQRWQQRL